MTDILEQRFYAAENLSYNDATHFVRGVYYGFALFLAITVEAETVALEREFLKVLYRTIRSYMKEICLAVLPQTAPRRHEGWPFREGT